MRYSIAIPTAVLLILAPAPIFACKCVSTAPDAPTGRAYWDARRNANVVFEGKAESAKVKWRFLDARVGELIPADLEADDPGMQVTFEVLRDYSDTHQKHLQLRTGFGGGDCGFNFEVGERYLVDAYKDDSGQLSTGICSNTALLDDSQAEIAYLRGELATSQTVDAKPAVKKAQLCGHLVLDNAIGRADGVVLLFREGSSSLIPSGEAEPGTDGSFCITDIPSGKYFMAFSAPERSPTSFVLFPGVATFHEAKPIDIAAGQEISHLLFTVTHQRTYTVSGRLSNFSDRQRQAAPKVLLLSIDRLLLALSYDAEVGPDGTFSFPQVLPGKYCAIVDVELSSDATTKWSTRKVELEVDGNVRDLTLDLVAN